MQAVVPLLRSVVSCNEYSARLAVDTAAATECSPLCASRMSKAACTRSVNCVRPDSCQPFRIAPARMQNPFRVAVRLRAAYEDQVAGGPQCRAVVAGRHRPIVWITGVFAVDV